MGYEDWDCPEAFDFMKFHNDVRNHCDRLSNEESQSNDTAIGEEDMGDIALAPAQLGGLLEMARKRGRKNNIVLVEGILTFWDEDKLDGIFYRKIFITADYQMLKDRREKRIYLLSDGEEWKDPPHYFEKIAWPRYIQYNQEFLQTTENSDVLRLYSDQQSLYEMLEAAIDRVL